MIFFSIFLILTKGNSTGMAITFLYWGSDWKGTPGVDEQGGWSQSSLEGSLLGFTTAQSGVLIFCAKHSPSSPEVNMATVHCEKHKLQHRSWWHLLTGEDDKLEYKDAHLAWSGHSWWSPPRVARHGAMWGSVTPCGVQGQQQAPTPSQALYLGDLNSKAEANPP